jgi:hypothetical protein
MKGQNFFAKKVGSTMINQEIQDKASKKIADTLELLEMAGYDKKHIDVIRKAMWSLFDFSILINKVGSNDITNITK